MKNRARISNKTPRDQVNILDATAFYAGIPYASTDTYRTTQSVVAEVLHGKMKSAAIQGLLDSGRLMVTQPTEKSLHEVRELASKTGDLPNLSQTDLSILALAIDMRGLGSVTLSSDDYSVQNLAKSMGITVSASLTRGIRKTAKWLKYCTGCGQRHHRPSAVICETCGTILKRKFTQLRSPC